jgi:hypothetical protein
MESTKTPFYCNICKIQYKSNGMYISHMHTHFKNEPYLLTAEEISKINEKYPLLKKTRHEYYLNSKDNYKCNICDQISEKYNDIMAHKFSHLTTHASEFTGEEIVEITRLNDLRKQQKINSRIKQKLNGDSTCSICSKVYCSPTYLNIHLHKHLETHKDNFTEDEIADITSAYNKQQAREEKIRKRKASSMEQ